MNDLIPYPGMDGVRVMLFVDGENLGVRVSSMHREGGTIAPEVLQDPGIWAWNPALNHQQSVALVRKYLYTSVQGDDTKQEAVRDGIKKAGIEIPRVFKRTRDKGSKRVDITLACDVLLHAVHRHIDIAVLVAGDEDYVPLVETVQREGIQVHVWFVSDGLSPALRRSADCFRDIDRAFFVPKIAG